MLCGHLPQLQLNLLCLIGSQTVVFICIKSPEIMKVSIVLFAECAAALVKGLVVSESFLVLCSATIIISIVHLSLSCLLQLLGTELQVMQFMPVGFISHQLVYIDVLSKTISDTWS